jgi:GNAT superfamily N-acetyltransferase
MKDVTSEELVELSPDEDDVPVRCDRGVALMPRADRLRHAPDRSILAVRHGSLVARCSCWWRGTASLDGARTGVIGHYEASDGDSGIAVLSRACEVLAAAGCTAAIGPMDGTTWRPYRFIVCRGDEPPFFLEPQNRADWPGQWASAGFLPLASYTSAVTHDLRAEDARSRAASRRVAAAGITIRAFDTAQPDAELRRIFRLSTRSFSRNFLYSPIAESEFLEQYRALLPFARPELILVAEQKGNPGGNLVGVAVAVPDALQARRGLAVDTVIVKTVGVDPTVSSMGLGGLLVELVQREASRLGFRRAIHALMHETNRSRRISDRHATTFRRYALLTKALAP